MCSVGVAGIQGMQAAGKEECVFGESVIEVVVYKLPQLGTNR